MTLTLKTGLGIVMGAIVIAERTAGANVWMPKMDAIFEYSVAQIAWRIV